MKRCINESWAVTVERNCEQVVTVASNHLSGRDLSADDKQIIRTAAHHLLSFLGDPAAEGRQQEPEKPPSFFADYEPRPKSVEWIDGVVHEGCGTTLPDGGILWSRFRELKTFSDAAGLKWTARCEGCGVEISVSLPPLESAAEGRQQEPQSAVIAEIREFAEWMEQGGSWETKELAAKARSWAHRLTAASPVDHA